MPERSFFIKGHQFPVCARCTGLYIGLVWGIIIFYLYNFNFNVNWTIIGLILIIPTIIDGVTQLFKFRESTNYLRLVTGLFGGVGLAFLAINSVVVFKLIYG